MIPPIRLAAGAPALELKHEGEGSDAVWKGRPATVVAAPAAAVTFGTSGRDVIVGSRGPDSIAAEGQRCSTTHVVNRLQMSRMWSTIWTCRDRHARRLRRRLGHYWAREVEPPSPLGDPGLRIRSGRPVSADLGTFRVISAGGVGWSSLESGTYFGTRLRSEMRQSRKRRSPARNVRALGHVPIALGDVPAAVGDAADGFDATTAVVYRAVVGQPRGRALDIEAIIA